MEGAASARGAPPSLLGEGAVEEEDVGVAEEEEKEAERAARRELRHAAWAARAADAAHGPTENVFSGDD